MSIKSGVLGKAVCPNADGSYLQSQMPFPDMMEKLVMFSCRLCFEGVTETQDPPAEAGS